MASTPAVAAGDDRLLHAGGPAQPLHQGLDILGRGPVQDLRLLFALGVQGIQDILLGLGTESGQGAQATFSHRPRQPLAVAHPKRVCGFDLEQIRQLVERAGDVFVVHRHGRVSLGSGL
jgi:hypothetical protein